MIRMGKLTKTGFAASKKTLGLKGKLTRKQVQRVFKHAIKKLGRSRSRSTRTKTTRKKKSNPIRRKTNLAKKKRRGGKSITRTAFKLIRLGALVAPAAARAMESTSPDEKVKRAILDYTGFNIGAGQWQPENLLRGWGPYLGACLTTYGIPKLTSIIRRL